MYNIQLTVMYILCTSLYVSDSSLVSKKKKKIDGYVHLFCALSVYTVLFIKGAFDFVNYTPFDKRILSLLKECFALP